MARTGILEGDPRSQHSEGGGGRRQRRQRMDSEGGEENSGDITTYKRPIFFFSGTVNM